MRPRVTEQGPLVSLTDIAEIELVILKRMREVTLGDHRSRSHGSGFDFIGLRDWQPGDSFSSIDWGQSSLTNFSPLVIREFEQPSTGTIMAIADCSLSTRCGVNGVPIAAAVARAIATIGVSAVLFQDLFGLVTFDEGFTHLRGIRARTGKGHVVHCLEAFRQPQGEALTRRGSIADALNAHLRGTSMLPVISDFLFDDWLDVLRELAFVNAKHDVFLVLVDSSYAFELPTLSAGWIDAVDVETGRSRTISRGTMAKLATHVREWQASVRQAAKDLDLDVVNVSVDQTQTDLALSEFVIERRLRKVYD